MQWQRGDAPIPDAAGALRWSSCGVVWGFQRCLPGLLVLRGPGLVSYLLRPRRAAAPAGSGAESARVLGLSGILPTRDAPPGAVTDGMDVPIGTARANRGP